MRLHGVRTLIVSNRDPGFVSHFWKSLNKALGTQLNLSMAFRSQTDGQLEKTIQFLKDMLRAYILNYVGGWHQHIQMVEFAYNNSYKASIRISPFEKKVSIAFALEWSWWEDNFGPRCVGESRKKSRNCTTTFGDSSKSTKAIFWQTKHDLEFQVGEQVFLKISPSKGVKRFRMHGKLSPWYIGPLEVLERVGLMAYWIPLPLNLVGVHDVFHVSKAYIWSFSCHWFCALELR